MPPSKENPVDALASLPDVGFFEGAEKLCEIWFERPDEFQVCPSTGYRGLRVLRENEWAELLTLCKCTIVSQRSNDHLDSYVLSESSLFVWDDHFVLKTCGTTTLLAIMKEVIQVAPARCGLHVVRDLFFSRKNFSRPEEQSFPHYSFDAEVAFLDDILSHRGIAYTLGRINGDAWHLYMLDHHSTPPGTPSSGLQSPASLMSSSTTTNDDDDNAPATPPATVVARTQPKAAVMADQTLEVIMTHLPLETMVQFYKLHDFVDSKTTTKTSGIATIFPEAVTDEVMFDPCGYSVNGVLDDCYFTIHITPQPECSYVSFETNIHTQPFTCVVNKVLRLFQPGRVSVSVFATEQSSPDAALHPTALHGYRPLDRQSCSLPHYTLDYFHFVRASSDLSPSST